MPEREEAEAERQERKEDKAKYGRVNKTRTTVTRDMELRSRTQDGIDARYRSKADDAAVLAVWGASLLSIAISEAADWGFQSAISTNGLLFFLGGRGGGLEIPLI